MKVALFVTCLVDQLYPKVGIATVELLRSLGAEVVFNRRQTCCGQPAFNTGYAEEAARVGRCFLETFRDSEIIVTPSGSCATMVKKFIPELMESDPDNYAIARAVADRTWELSDFLVNVLKVSDVGASFPHTVTFHDSCHQLRELGIFNQPRELIRAVRDVNFVELTDSTRCCGFGGTFAVKFDELSSAIGEDKVNRIQESGAEVVVANDVSCLMQIDGLLRRRQIPVRTMHLAELLTQKP
jgi:L-lactate dehydrogenase complex protein LldE